MVLVCDPVDDSGSGVGLWTNGVIKNDEFLLEDAEKYQIQSIANGKISKKDLRRCCGNVVQAIFDSPTQREYIG